MTLDPRFQRFAKLSGLDQWFNQEGLLRIQQAFLAAPVMIEQGIPERPLIILPNLGTPRFIGVVEDRFQTAQSVSPSC